MNTAVAISGRDLSPVLSAEILSARRSVWVSAFLLDIGFGRDLERRARQIARLLGQASGDGLDVRLLLARPGLVSVTVANHAAALYAAWLGVPARISNRDMASHAKLALFDGVRCLVGGHNLTHSGLTQNEDLTMLVDAEGSEIVDDAARRFVDDWDHAISVDVVGTSLEGVTQW